MVARGASLAEVLDFVILAVEKQATVDFRASILLLDPEKKQLLLCAAPSLPESYCQATTSFAANPQEDPLALAVSLEQPLVVADLAAAPEWTHVAQALSPCAIRSSLDDADHFVG